jgi:hypothetical protein
VKLRGDAASVASRGLTVHPLFEVLYAAAAAKGIATMQHWVRGSAVAGLEPIVKPTDEHTGHRLSFAGWLKLLDASIADPRARPDAAVVLNGCHASGPDVIALFSPASFRGNDDPVPAAVFVQCRRQQTPATEQTWKEAVLSVLDGFVQMGAPAFQFAKCRHALGLPKQDMPLRVAFDVGAAERGAEALGSAAAHACFVVVVQCRAASATKDHGKGSDYDLQVERAICDILKAHATAKSPHARCFYIRTHPGDTRFAPILAQDESGFLIVEPGTAAKARW